MFLSRTNENLSNINYDEYFSLINELWKGTPNGNI